MLYNQSCSAGVAHLVERDLAKVEVASSSLVARSKKCSFTEVEEHFPCQKTRGIFREGVASVLRGVASQHTGRKAWLAFNRETHMYLRPAESTWGLYAQKRETCVQP